MLLVWVEGTLQCRSSEGFALNRISIVLLGSPRVLISVLRERGLLPKLSRTFWNTDQAVTLTRLSVKHRLDAAKKSKQTPSSSKIQTTRPASSLVQPTSRMTRRRTEYTTLSMMQWTLDGEPEGVWLSLVSLPRRPPSSIDNLLPCFTERRGRKQRWSS